MTTNRDNLENLLGQATPRPVPSQDKTDEVREALRAEWRQTTGRRRTRRRIVSFAAAASVLLVVMLVVNVLPGPTAISETVANVVKSSGSIHFRGEQSDINEAMNLSEILSGQTIMTGTDSVIGLEWGAGGSLRIGAQSQVLFRSADTIELLAGRVYFDSQPAVVGVPPQGYRATLNIHTDNGVLTHIGTRYMAEVDNGRLIVSVREGRVRIDGAYHNRTAETGKQVTLVGRAQPTVLDIATYGDNWQWVELAAPVVDVDRHSIHDFLLWVSRETGLDLEFENLAVEQDAQDEELRGSVNTEPREALRQRLLTTDFRSSIDEGVLTISSTGM